MWNLSLNLVNVHGNQDGILNSRNPKTLCTVYPRENYFTVLVVIGKKEKETTEELLINLSPLIQSIYHETKEGMGQRWLMIDLEDKDKKFSDVLKLIDVRAKCK